MQHLTRTEFEAVVNELSVFRGVRPLQHLVTSIPLITEQRMTDVFHVGTDLVSPSRFQHTFHPRRITKFLQYLIMCHSTFPNLRIRRKHRHAHPVFRVSPYITFNSAFILREVTPHQCIVLTFCGLVEKLQAQTRLRRCRLRHHQKSAGILIDAVHQSYLRIIDVILRHILQVPGNGIQHRTVPIAKPWMHHHTRRFVDDHQVTILIHNVQWDILRRDFVLIMRAIQHHLNHIVRFHLIGTLHRLAVRHDETGICRLLNTVTAGTGQLCEQELIDTKQLLSLVSYDTMMFIQL